MKKGKEMTLCAISIILFADREAESADNSNTAPSSVSVFATVISAFT
ncbi:hypothetical protein Barb6_02370 [Bacteroidales bacterium Barb6]|nr:hypothetical protein Barb6_02370 [Bacteroidales bacterium Barb6]